MASFQKLYNKVFLQLYNNIFCVFELLCIHNLHRLIQIKYRLQVNFKSYETAWFILF